LNPQPEPPWEGNSASDRGPGPSDDLTGGANDPTIDIGQDGGAYGVGNERVEAGAQPQDSSVSSDGSATSDATGHVHDGWAEANEAEVDSPGDVPGEAGSIESLQGASNRD